MAQSSTTKFLDQNQIDVMSKIDDWWSPKGALGCLLTFNKVRVPFICRSLKRSGRIKDAYAENCLEGVKVLDIGSGGGIVSEGLAKRGATVIGIEPVEAACRAAKKHLITESPEIKDKVTYLCETIEEHCANNNNAGFYDVVVASEVIEHVEHKDSFIKACSTVMKEGGSFFVTTPNKTFAAWFITRLWFELILAYIPRFSHQFSWFIHHDKLEEKFKENGVVMKNLKGIFYIPVWDKWFIIKYTGVHYIAHFVKENSKKSL